MADPELLKRISIDPQVCGGRPVISGTRIWVTLILERIASGDSFQKLLEDYPHIKHEDLLACVAYGAAMSSDRFIDIPVKRPA